MLVLIHGNKKYKLPMLWYIKHDRFKPLQQKMGCYTSIYYIFIEIKVKFDQETSCVDTVVLLLFRC